ncbi:hypothetical protein H0H93_009793 [Arthromyces matolae]|nr:hypothetical protein H0H93_009793 [Arthromyces matolae]
MSPSNLHALSGMTYFLHKPPVRLTWILTDWGPSSSSKISAGDNIPSESGGLAIRLDLHPDVEEGNHDVSGVPPPYDVTQRDTSPVYGRV